MSQNLKEKKAVEVLGTIRHVKKNRRKYVYSIKKKLNLVGKIINI